MFFKFGPSFASAQLARALRGFLSRPTCLAPVLAGGSTVNSSSQNKSWFRTFIEIIDASNSTRLSTTNYTTNNNIYTKYISNNTTYKYIGFTLIS
jgi:hypothetical protein